MQKIQLAILWLFNYCWCPEARHISGNQGGSPATTGVPMLAWDPMFTLDLGVAWNIEAWHVV